MDPAAIFIRQGNEIWGCIEKCGQKNRVIWSVVYEFEVDRGKEADRAMGALAVQKAVDVIEDFGAGLAVAGKISPGTGCTGH